MCVGCAETWCLGCIERAGPCGCGGLTEGGFLRPLGEVEAPPGTAAAVPCLSTASSCHLTACLTDTATSLGQQAAAVAAAVAAAAAAALPPTLPPTVGATAAAAAAAALLAPGAPTGAAAPQVSASSGLAAAAASAAQQHHLPLPESASVTPPGLLPACGSATLAAGRRQVGWDVPGGDDDEEGPQCSSTGGGVCR